MKSARHALEDVYITRINDMTMTVSSLYVKNECIGH